MKLFRSLSDVTDRDWAKDYINSGLIPSYSHGYVGISTLKNSDVLTGVSIIAGDVARFPVKLIDKRTGKPTKMSKLDYLLNTKTDTNFTAYQWRFSMVVNAILTGDSYSRIIRDPITGVPSVIEFFPPSQTDVDTTDPQKPVYKFYPPNSGKMIVCQLEDVIHYKFFSADGVLGRSPLLSLHEEMGLQDSGVATLKKFFSSGLKGSILKIKGSLNGKARQKARKEFEIAQEGASAGSPIVVDSATEYQPLEVDTNVLNLINSNNYSTAQIAKALRVPAYKLAQNSPNQSVKQLFDDYMVNDLPFYLKPFEAELALKLLNNAERQLYSIQFDTRATLNMPMSDVATAVNNGVLTPNEARYAAGFETLPDKDMDRLQSTLNTVFMDQKEDYQAVNKGNQAQEGGQTDDEGSTDDDKPAKDQDD